MLHADGRQLRRPPPRRCVRRPLVQQLLLLLLRRPLQLPRPSRDVSFQDLQATPTLGTGPHRALLDCKHGHQWRHRPAICCSCGVCRQRAGRDAKTRLPLRCCPRRGTPREAGRA